MAFSLGRARDELCLLTLQLSRSDSTTLVALGNALVLESLIRCSLHLFHFYGTSVNLL